MRRIFLFLLCLTSCASKDPWHYSKAISDCSIYNSANLFHCASNRFTGIELQFLKGSFGTLCFLNVGSREIPSFNQDPCKAIAILEIEGQKFSFIATRMAGGQTILLPSEAQDQLIKALCQKAAVTLYLDGFMSKISSDKFWAHYKNFQKVPT